MLRDCTRGCVAPLSALECRGASFSPSMAHIPRTCILDRGVPYDGCRCPGDSFLCGFAECTSLAEPAAYSITFQESLVMVIRETNHADATNDSERGTPVARATGVEWVADV